MPGLHVKVLGEGPPAVLVHGSGGSSGSWIMQHELADRYRLILPDRRGYGSSPPAAVIDYEVDARDVAEFLGDGAHLVGQSYGAVVALAAAGRRPDAVLSLAVLEPPILGMIRGHPGADAIMDRMRHVYETMQGTSPEEFDAAFDAAIGFPHPPAPLDPETRKGVQTMMKERLPFDADIPFDRLAAAPFPKLVASGGWSPAFEALCDALALRLRAQRVAVPGAGHAIHRTGRPLNEKLDALWSSVRPL